MTKETYKKLQLIEAMLYGLFCGVGLALGIIMM